MKSEHRRLHTILNCMWYPFCVIRHHLHDFCLWFVFVILASQLGIIINVIKRWGFDGNGFQEALVPDSESGYFYTFCIVMCASLIWPIFKTITHRKQPEYNLINTILLAVLFIIVLLGAVFFSFSSISPHRFYVHFCDDWKALDVPQFICFILAIIFSIYSFGLTYLPNHQDKFPIYDDYWKNRGGVTPEAEAA